MRMVIQINIIFEITSSTLSYLKLQVTKPILCGAGDMLQKHAELGQRIENSNSPRFLEHISGADTNAYSGSVKSYKKLKPLKSNMTG